MPRTTQVVPLFPLRIDLELMGAFRAPEYLGGLLRGGFGKYFRALACETQAPTCKDCMVSERCAYSTVFETPVNPDRVAVLRKYPNAPHPFVLAPEMSPKNGWRDNATIPIHLTILGPAVRYFPQFLAVFSAMGREGRFGGYFRIRRVVAADRGVTIFDGGSGLILREPPAWEPVQRDSGTWNRLRIRFVTPLRMRTGGLYVSRPTFPAMTQTLLRRIVLLRALYGDGSTDTAWMKPLLQAADGASVEFSEWRPFAWSRTSGRQERRIAMDGVLGELVVRGELGELLPWYELGEWVQMGNGTSMGLGRFRVEVK